MINITPSILYKVIISVRKMNPDEIRNLIDEQPYQFTKEDIPNPRINIYEREALHSWCYLTPAMYWIKRWKSEPPEALRHDPSISDNFGDTCAMYWIATCEDDVPIYLRHDPTVRNMNGYTCAMYWIKYRKCDVPIYLRHDPAIQTIIGETCAMLWIKLRKYDYVPKYLQHDDNIKTIKGETCNALNNGLEVAYK